MHVDTGSLFFPICGLGTGSYHADYVPITSTNKYQNLHDSFEKGNKHYHTNSSIVAWLMFNHIYMCTIILCQWRE